MNEELYPTLPDELAFELDGHASEFALTALADGQTEALAAKVHEHVDGCRVCTTRLGVAALLSARIGGALRARAEESAPVTALVPLVPVAPTAPRLPLTPRRGSAVPRDVPRRRPMPWAAVSAALALAVVSAGPWFRSESSSLSIPSLRGTLDTGVHLVMMMARGAWHPSRAAIALQWAAAFVFIVVGLIVATRVGRGRRAEGDAQ